MDNKERSFIKYRPDIKYVPKILSIVNPSATYEPTEVVSKLLDATPSGVIGGLLDAVDDMNVLSQRLSKCLDGYNAGGVTFKDYANRFKTKSDGESISRFELANRASEAGSIQAEVYPLILSTVNECEGMINILNKELYKNTIDLAYLQVAEEKDKAFMDKTIEREVEGKLTSKEYNAVETIVILVEIANRVLQNSKNFIKDMNNLLCSTIDTYYNGNIVDIVSKFGEAEINTLEAIKDTSRLSFKKSVMAVDNDMTRHNRLNRNDMKTGVIDMFLNISKLRDYGGNDISSWISTIDTDYDSNPLTQIVCDALDGIEFINTQYVAAMGECFKQVKLDELVKNDLSTTLLEKKYARQKLKLISDIISEKKNGSFKPEAFVEKQRLKLKGNLCSK